MVINYRLYTALFFLNKGNYKAFYDLLCIDDNKNKNKWHPDIKLLIDKGYIIFKDANTIILTEKTERLLKTGLKKDNKKEKNENDIDEQYINMFLEGFPSNRFGNVEEIKRELKYFYLNSKYTKEEILEAKNQYVKDERSKNYVYIKKPVNFIIKDLDNYCRYLRINNNKSNINNNGLFMV